MSNLKTQDMRNTLLILAVGLLSVFTFASCKNDGHSLDNYWVARATVDSIDNNTYSLLLDDGTKLWIAASVAPNYKPKNQQRLFINFTILSDKQGQYDHYIRLNNLSEILTKNIVNLTEVNKDSIGNNPVEIIRMNTNGGFLNVDFAFNFGNKRHFINLVRNTTVTPPADGKVYLEFRHNAYDDVASSKVKGSASFKLSELQKPGTDSVKLVVKVKEFGGDVSYDLVYKFKSKTSEKSLEFIEAKPLD